MGGSKPNHRGTRRPPMIRGRELAGGGSDHPPRWREGWRRYRRRAERACVRARLRTSCRSLCRGPCASIRARVPALHRLELRSHLSGVGPGAHFDFVAAHCRARVPSRRGRAAGPCDPQRPPFEVNSGLRPREERDGRAAAQTTRSFRARRVGCALSGGACGAQQLQPEHHVKGAQDAPYPRSSKRAAPLFCLRDGRITARERAVRTAAERRRRALGVTMAAAGGGKVHAHRDWQGRPPRI
ncbi:hypothetical protein PHLGIDRAFT_304651 [Phlebiopsis gigantea 11061_1 CR5-6]|uniref:Uncharacterized protein n=1 Tax=Phlebiopsis gigantea (strain 11061_1 CR5-6) TaxID=745531 RepID=A0A0C3RQT3_PHLG1|nr:hypothetical protein PHLGIDRAFT_304651 [Phlebiopsis gigantea 11061_1 CR5-6]